MRVAVYVHVPREDGIETAEDRLRRLEDMASRDGWRVSSVYCDQVSLGNEERPEYERMILDAEQHRFDVLLFWALENLSSLNSSRSLALLHKLSEWGIRFCAYKDQHLNTCHSLKDQVVSLIATFAQQDNVYISRRTIAGLKGKSGVGRPEIKFDEEKAKRLYEQEVDYGKIAKQCDVSASTIQRFFERRGTARSVGRPPAEFDEEKAERLRGQIPPATYREIAEACKVSKKTIFRFFKNRKQKSRK